MFLVYSCFSWDLPFDYKIFLMEESQDSTMKTGKIAPRAIFLLSSDCILWEINFSLSNCQVVLTSQQMQKEVRKRRTITSNQRVLNFAYSPFVSQQRNEMCLTNVHAATQGHLAHLFFIASENRILGEYSGMCRVLLLVLVGTSVKGLLLPFAFYAAVFLELSRSDKGTHFLNSIQVFPHRVVSPRARSDEHAHEPWNMFSAAQKCLIHSEVRDSHIGGNELNCSILSL